MSNFPSNFSRDGIVTAGVVTGGHINEKPQDQSCDLKVVDPIRHGPKINPKKLPFITSIRSCTQADLEEFNPPPEPGTMVYVMSMTGEPSGRVVLGQPNGQNNPQSSPGNFNLWPIHGTKAEMEKCGKNTCKGFETKTRNGKEVREPKNGEEWMHKLTQGLPTHAALFPMAGTVIPAIQKIETAVQQFAGILNSNMLSQLPGQLMSLSSLFSQMSASQQRKAKEKMPPEVATAFDSMTNLMQSADASGAFATDLRVNQDVFLENAATLFSQVTNLSDLMTVMQRLQTDEAIRGLDQLPKAKITSETAFGTFSFDMDVEGNLVFDDVVDANTGNVVSVSSLSNIYYVSDEQAQNTAPQQSQSGGGGSGNQQVLQAIQQFASQMLSGAQNAGTSAKDNLFKDQAQKISEMMGRIPTEASKLMTADMKQAMSGFGPQITKDVKNLVTSGSLSEYFRKFG